MSEAKIEIKIGEMVFSGEGSADWLSQQLDKILGKAETLLEFSPKLRASDVPPTTTHPSGAHHLPADLSHNQEIANQPLALWLKSKNAETVQNTKFLATSIWLEAKGQRRLQTNDISKALSNANQRRLNNASECLNQNVKKGFIEKEAGGFFVTEEGKRSLGIN